MTPFYDSIFSAKKSHAIDYNFLILNIILKNFIKIKII